MTHSFLCWTAFCGLALLGWNTPLPLLRSRLAHSVCVCACGCLCMKWHAVSSHLKPHTCAQLFVRLTLKCALTCVCVCVLLWSTGDVEERVLSERDIVGPLYEIMRAADFEVRCLPLSCLRSNNLHCTHTSLATTHTQMQTKCNLKATLHLKSLHKRMCTSAESDRQDHPQGAGGKVRLAHGKLQAPHQQTRALLCVCVCLSVC